MGVEAGADVVFDYVGALSLARQLWVLADQLETYGADRELASATALTGWSGEYATQFAGRCSDERTTKSSIVGGLRGDAVKWAQAWASATNEQNKILWARHDRKLKDDQSGWDNFWNGFHDDTPHPQPVSTPAAPYFSATASLVSY